MATDADPYRTLGLPRGASLDEVKRAYRRLVKAHHPDAAGEADLPRFLAIQAAYDQIVGPGASSAAAARRAAPRRPWDADPDRAEATRRAYGGRGRRTRAGGPRPAGGGTSDQRPPGAAAGSSGDGSDGGPAGGPERPPNKARLGSTSYDGAEAEPFEPDWGGASWYGTTSGTYWTLNPKEYADPRKHGPEYQARARRAAAAQRDTGDASGAGDPPWSAGDGPASGQGPAAEGPPASAQADPPPSHTTSSWWDATTGQAPDEGPADPSSTDPAADTPGSTLEREAAPSWLDAGSAGIVLRVGRAVIGWAPIALGIGWVAGEVTGCGRFSADCDAASAPLAWFAQVAVLAVLLLVPRLATVTTVATLAAVAAAVPGALILTAGGAAADPGAGGAALGGLLLIAWGVGLAIGIARELRSIRDPVGPVS